MKSVEALVLIEQGNIIELEGFLYKNVDGVLCSLSKDSFVNSNAEWERVDEFFFEEWSTAKIYKPEKVKQQYYQVFYKYGEYLPLLQSERVFLSVKDFLDYTQGLESDYSFIQLIPVGEPV